MEWNPARMIPPDFLELTLPRPLPCRSATQPPSHSQGKQARSNAGVDTNLLSCCTCNTCNRCLESNPWTGDCRQRRSRPTKKYEPNFHNFCQPPRHSRQHQHDFMHLYTCVPPFIHSPVILLHMQSTPLDSPSWNILPRLLFIANLKCP